MSNFDLKSITSALQEAPSRTGVSFLGKALKWETESGAKELIDAIEACASLQFLDLEGNTLGVEAAVGIAKALEKHPELKEALWKDLFTGRMKTEIPLALKALGGGMIAAGAQLTVLDCSDNALGPNGMTGLVDLIESSTCFTLQQLKLNNCGLGVTGGKMLAKALLACHEASSRKGKPLALKLFIAGRNRLENDGSKALAEVFGLIKTLEHVEMPQNGIYHPGITALSEAFKLNANLKMLNLNDNTIGPKGAAALAVAICDLQNLVEVNFGDCLLKTRGAIYIGEALQEGHNTIEVLNFGYNEIGPEGGFSIVSATYNKENLKSLILDANQFGYECREQLKDTLREYGRLEALGPLDEDDSEGEEEDEDYEEVEEEEEEEENQGEESDEAETDDVGESEQTGEGEELFEISAVTPEPAIRNILEEKKTTEIVDLDDSLPYTVEAYCRTHYPSETMFNALEEENKVEAFREYLKSLPSEDYLVYLAFTILKISEISEKSNEALSLSEALLVDAFDYAKNNNRLKSLRNFLLIQLGLLKCEDSSFKPGYNVQGCRHALKNAIKKNIVPEEEQSFFKVFLEHRG
ncbi:ran GTPase-activating protein [Toxorhynchites rutilus septentrionalis]|uniref:ran GTPase-activating protein n=1 Tax=Toxorhynchites rutilus septentrionalis TaxID=329112 RepID=UPI002479E696|nr:ran GTPase-activating protein [Toxorhynchites rutilus septentrionalis]